MDVNNDTHADLGHVVVFQVEPQKWTPPPDHAMHTYLPKYKSDPHLKAHKALKSGRWLEVWEELYGIGKVLLLRDRDTADTLLDSEAPTVVGWFEFNSMPPALLMAMAWPIEDVDVDSKALAEHLGAHKQG